MPITLVVTTVNSLTFIVTAIAGYFLGEASFSLNIVIGTVLILIGIVLTALF